MATIKELLEEYNSMVPEGDRLASWKRKKAEREERVAEARREAAAILDGEEAA